MRPYPRVSPARPTLHQHRSGALAERGHRWLAYGLALVLILPFAADGANSALLSAAATILYLGWAALAFLLVSSDHAVIRRLGPVAIPLILLLVWTAIPMAPDLARGIVPPPLNPDLLGIAWCHAVALVALLLGCGIAGRLRGFAREVAVGLCVCAALLIIAMLSLRAFGESGLSGTMVEQRDHRFIGLMGNANAAGISFGMISLIMTGVARDRWESWRGRSRVHPPLAVAVALVGAIVTLVLVALTQSRTAFAATLVAHGVYALTGRPASRASSTSRGRRVAALLTLTLGATAVWLAATSVFTRYSIADVDGSNRITVLSHYGRLVRDVPVFGYGLGGFDRFNQQHLTPDTVMLVGDFGAAHNALLQLAIEAGWPAVALVAAALTGIGSAIWRARGVLRATLARAMLLAVAVAGAGSMIDIALNVPAIAALTVALLGLVWGRTLGDFPDDAPGPLWSRQRETPVASPWPTPAMRN